MSGDSAVALESVRSRRWQAIRAWTLAPYVLALFFALWALRGASSNIVDTDATRHAMNGVFLLDLVAEGKLAQPLEFARSYYSRLPALSIPYHPPLFPAFESLFFFVFGVNPFAARLAIAVATALCVLLFYRLVVATHGSPAIALVATLLFFSLPSVQFVAGDVMLEFPTLAFVLAAVWCLRGLDRGFPLRRGLAFALFAGAAVWTKQNAVYLGLVPFLYVAIERRWRLLLGKTIWIASALFGAMVMALAALSVVMKSAGNSAWPRGGPLDVLAHNVPYYLGAVRDELGLPAALFLAAAFLWLLAWGRPFGLPWAGGTACPTSRRNGLYLAWVAAVFLLVWFLPPFDSRYLFFAYAPLAVIATAAMFRIGERLLAPRRAWLVPAAVAVAWCAVQLPRPASYVGGPAQAALRIASAPPGRVLYCGRSNGHFIFFTRSLDPSLRAVVIRGDKLPPATFTAAEFEKFAHQYGIRHIVIERRAGVAKGWDRLFDSPSPSMEFEAELPLASSDRLLNGRLRLYRFRNPSPNPESTLKLRTLGGGQVEAEF